MADTNVLDMNRLADVPAVQLARSRMAQVARLRAEVVEKLMIAEAALAEVENADALATVLSEVPSVEIQRLRAQVREREADLAMMDRARHQAAREHAAQVEDAKREVRRQLRAAARAPLRELERHLVDAAGPNERLAELHASATRLLGTFPGGSAMPALHWPELRSGRLDYWREYVRKAASGWDEEAQREEAS